MSEANYYLSLHSLRIQFLFLPHSLPAKKKVSSFADYGKDQVMCIEIYINILQIFPLVPLTTEA